MSDTTKVVETEQSTFRIVRQFPAEDTPQGKGEHSFDYAVEQYKKGFDEEQMKETAPKGRLHVDEGELEEVIGVEMPTYPRCDCGNPVDMNGECTYCRHGFDSSGLEE